MHVSKSFYIMLRTSKRVCDVGKFKTGDIYRPPKYDFHKHIRLATLPTNIKGAKNITTNVLILFYFSFFSHTITFSSLLWFVIGEHKHTQQGRKWGGCRQWRKA